ncbi:MAG: hypothetical protein M1834_003320 [Cirrosporium novae-zelandiae]|nr:MAG: hypothetical protein M1834_003320 [Cirrosporium novae-zelandiae]
MTGKTLEIEETDEAGNVIATYFESHPTNSSASRIDVAYPPHQNNIPQKVLSVFLPAGYPNSVTHDYLEYQIYVGGNARAWLFHFADQRQDSLQAFSSSIAGLLSNRAVLQGVGVGDADASPTAALLLTVLQESMGRLATIWFAHSLGTSLEPECKMYRLAADVFNDGAMILDCLSPALPKAPRVVLLSCSSILRALCGVAAGSAKASLSAHFAKWGNLGELNAKDSSQETIISLMGMLAGSLVVSQVSSTWATWFWLISLLSIHLAMNYAAVRAVSMHTLNRQRANIVFSSLIEDDKVLAPGDTSIKEKIFEKDGVLRWKGSTVLRYCQIGVPLGSLLSSLGQVQHGTRSIREMNIDLSVLRSIYHSEQYLLWYNARQEHAYIVLKQGVTANSQLKGWVNALMVARRISRQRHQHGAEPHKTDNQEMLQILKEELSFLSEDFDGWIKRLHAVGWDTDIAALETLHGSRILEKD